MDKLNWTILALTIVAQVRGSLVSQSWSEVIVSADKITQIKTFLGSSVKAAGLCSAEESCTMVCKIDGDYVLSNSVYQPDYYEKSTEVKHKCWTRLPNRFTPIELTEDGLFYHADLRAYYLTYDECIAACRRIPGFRLCIARSDESAQAWKTYFGSKEFYIGLTWDGITLKWHDGTPYSQTITVPVQFDGNRFRLMFEKFWGLPKEKEKYCLCQGNPNNLEW